MFELLSLFFFISALIPVIQDQSGGTFIAMSFALIFAILASTQSKPHKPKIKYRDGYIYVMKSHTNEIYYKIGMTRDLHRRTKMFNVKLPFDVELICTFKTRDMYKLERELHQRFASKRVIGTEWFILDDEDLKWLKLFKPSTE